ncbi:hypothetical protein B0H14DRAFT_2563321 [Mycena olivaceomarginata]|nr:hypothetical protein B0H14DRAFT_2563321 [Mycena olivaceomarginata]
MLNIRSMLHVCGSGGGVMGNPEEFCRNQDVRIQILTRISTDADFFASSVTVPLRTMATRASSGPQALPFHIPAPHPPPPVSAPSYPAQALPLNPNPPPRASAPSYPAQPLALNLMHLIYLFIPACTTDSGSMNQG